MERKTGTIEDIVAIAKSRSTDPEEQEKYIQNEIDLIIRDYPDEVTPRFISKRGYVYLIKDFSDSGGKYFWHNIYQGLMKVASVLEVSRDDEGRFEVLFSSNPAFCHPIIPMLYE